MAYIIENDVIVASLTKQLQTLSGNGHDLMFATWDHFGVCFCSHCFKSFPARCTLLSLHDVWFSDVLLYYFCSVFPPGGAGTLERRADALLIGFRDGLANDVTTSHPSSLGVMIICTCSFWTSYFYPSFKDSTCLDASMFLLLFRSSSTLLLVGVRSPTRIATLFVHVQWSIDPFKKPHSSPVGASRSLRVPKHG